ncbi:MAG: hypothetical protein AAGF47_11960, partial [Planctomycetota bacterium]
MSSTCIRWSLTLGRLALGRSALGRSAGLAAIAGLAVGLASGTAAAAEPGVDASLDRAVSLLASGELIAASELLDAVSDQPALSEAQQERLVEMVASLERRFKTADPIELNIQKAAAALADGDLAMLERHLQAAERSGAAGRAQAAAMDSLREQADGVRSSVAAFQADFESQAAADFAAGRFGRAKSTLMILTRAGVTLSAEADAVRLNVFEMELDRGAPFTSAVAAGLFQPGVLERLSGDEDDLPAIALFGDVSFDEAAIDEQPGVVRRENNGDQPAGDQPEQPDPDDILERSLRAGAQSKLANANMAYTNGELGRAARLYQELLSESREFLTAEQIEQVGARLRDAQIQLEQPLLDPDGIIDQTIEQIEAQRDRAKAQFESLMGQARASLAQDETQGARDAVAQARLELNASRDVLGAEYDSLYDQTVDLLERIGQEEIAIQERLAAELSTDLARRSAEQEAEQQRTRQAKINEQLDRARDLQLDMRYEESLQVLDQVLFLDPNNPAALLMKDVIYDIALVRQYNDILRERNRENSQLRLHNAEATIPITDLMSYPDDWPRISLQRGEEISIAESPEDRRVLADLESQRLPQVQFDNPLGDVIGFLETVTQQNFDVDWQSLELLSIDEQTPVQLRLNNVSVKTVLDRLVEKISDPLAPAGWAVTDGIVQVASDEVLRRNTVLVLYDIRDLLIRVPDYQDAPQIDLQSVLQSGQGGGG